MNYTVFFVNAIVEGKNITNYELFKIIQNITNIEGMDKVFDHIINSTHNDAFLKLIDTKFLNGTKYAIFNETFYSFRTPMLKLIFKILKKGVYTSEDEINKNIIVYVLEFIRDNPHIARKIFYVFKLYINDNKEILVSFLNQTDMLFLYNLTEDIVGLNSTFFDDLSDVIENHSEIMNHTLFFVNAIVEGRNITNYELFKAIENILNIDGMDKVFNHIINSTHNGALLILVEKF